ncbi:hypothetical protein GCM10029964_033050 [Kibdelosporangium lantanae]
MHRNASMTAVVFTVIHVVTLLFDPYAQLRVLDVVIPFAGADQPLWLGLGTVGFDLLLAVLVTSLLRHRIGRRAWRAVHWAAYAAWPVSVLHTVGEGSDVSRPWFATAVVVSVLAVLASLGWRLVPSRRHA